MSLRSCLAVALLAGAGLAIAGTEAETGTTRATAPEQRPASEDFDARPAKEGGFRRWRATRELVLRAAPTREAATRAALPDGALLSNLGCALSAGEVWCAVQAAFGGPKGHVRASALSPAQGPDGTIPRGPDDSKARLRRRAFDAVGEVGCAQERGQAMGMCTAQVARSGGGDATVQVQFANGFSRLLFFTHGRFRAANPTMSGTGTDTDQIIDGDLHVIRVDDQRFELGSRLLFGP